MYELELKPGQLTLADLQRIYNEPVRLSLHDSCYEQIEAAMSNSNSKYYKKYLKIREPNLHKIKPIPVCKIKKNVKQ